MMAQAQNRLHIRRIVSVGAVEKGDNAPAQILFWKAKPDDVDPPPLDTAKRLLRALGRNIQQRLPGISTADAMIEARRQRPDLAAVVTGQALDAQGARLDTATKTINEATEAIAAARDEKETSMSKQEPTAAEVRVEVDEKAAKLIAKDADLTLAEARATVWRSNPRLIDKSRRAPDAATAPAADVALSEQVAAAIAARAMELTAINWHDTPAQIRADLWKTPDGQRLMTLARDNRKPTTIAKAGDHTEARALLKQWQADPKADLPPIMVPPRPR